jgi:isocitrate dehydrogenase
VHNAWLKTIEDGIHTYDIFQEGVSKQKVGTKEFADAVSARMGQKPEKLKTVSYSKAPSQTMTNVLREYPPAKKELIGVDVFIHWRDRDPVALGKKIETFNGNGLELLLISNRGQKVYPGGFEETFCTDHWRLRFKSIHHDDPIKHEQVIDLLDRLLKGGYDFIKIENLYTFDGVKGFVSAQGE